MLHRASMAAALLACASAEWPPAGYAPDPDWKPSAPASLGVTGVSAVACLTQRCPEVYVAQARPSLIPSLCTHFARAGIEWRR